MVFDDKQCRGDKSYINVIILIIITSTQYIFLPQTHERRRSYSLAPSSVKSSRDALLAREGKAFQSHPNLLTPGYMTFINTTYRNDTIVTLQDSQHGRYPTVSRSPQTMASSHLSLTASRPSLTGSNQGLFGSHQSLTASLGSLTGKDLSDIHQSTILEHTQLCKDNAGGDDYLLSESIMEDAHEQHEKHINVNTSCQMSHKLISDLTEAVRHRSLYGTERLTHRSHKEICIIEKDQCSVSDCEDDNIGLRAMTCGGPTAQIPGIRFTDTRV